MKKVNERRKTVETNLVPNTSVPRSLKKKEFLKNTIFLSFALVENPSIGFYQPPPKSNYLGQEQPSYNFSSLLQEPHVGLFLIANQDTSKKGIELYLLPRFQTNKRHTRKHRRRRKNYKTTK